MSRLIFLTTLLCVLGAARASAQSSEDIGLSALDSLLNLPVQTAAKYEQRRAEVPAAVDIITSKQIAAYGYRTLADVFRNLPGFYTTDDLNYAYVGVRGFSRPTDYNTRLLILMDGHVMNEGFYGYAGVGTDFGFDLAMFDRIEVIRGPGSAVYGAQAMFAVVNLITKQGSQIDGIDVAARVGSAATREVSVLAGSTLPSGVDVALSAKWADTRGRDIYFPEFDDPSTNFGMAEGVDWDSRFSARAAITYGGLEVQSGLYSRRRAVPTAAWETEFNHPDAQTLDARGFVGVSYERRLGNTTHVSFRVRGDHYWYDGVYPYEANYLEANRSTWFGTETRFRWDPAPNQRIIVGVEGQGHLKADYRSWDADGEYFGGEFPYQTGSVYAQDELQFGSHVNVMLGVRADGYSTGEHSLSPRAAVLLYPATTATVKLLYGEAFRAPSVWEREYHAPETGYMINPALVPEKIRTTEAVWEQRYGRAFMSRASLYYYELTDLIDTSEEAAPDSLLVWGDSLIQYSNIAAASAVGTEIEITAVFDFGLSVYSSYTHQRARNRDSDAQLSNSPAHMAKAGFAWSFPTVTVGSNLVYEASRATVQDTRTDSYMLVDLTVSTRPFFNGMSVAGSIKNALGSTHWVPGGFEHTQAALPQPGRRAYIELRYHP